MTKLLYPSEGIYEYGQKHIEDAISNLKETCSKSYMCPNDFKYAAYVKNLRNELFGLYKTANSINNRLKRVDNIYERLSEVLLADKKMLDPLNIEERERLIV